MQNLRHWKEIKIHFFLIHVLVCLTVYEVNISLFNKFNRTFLCFPPPTHPTPNSLPGFQVIGDGQIFVIRVKIVLKEMGGEKSRHMRTWKLLTLRLSLYSFFFSFKSFLCTSLKSRYHKSSYFESFKIRNSVDDQLFRDYLGYYLDDF